MSKNKLFIGNLDYSIDSQALFDFLSQTWEINECRVIDGKGFGFVTFASEAACIEAKDKLNDSEFKGRNMKVDFAKERAPGVGGGGGGRSGGSGGPRKFAGGNRRRFD